MNSFKGAKIWKTVLNSTAVITNCEELIVYPDAHLKSKDYLHAVYFEHVFPCWFLPCFRPRLMSLCQQVGAGLFHVNIPGLMDDILKQFIPQQVFPRHLKWLLSQFEMELDPLSSKFKVLLSKILSSCFSCAAEVMLLRKRGRHKCRWLSWLYRFISDVNAHIFKLKFGGKLSMFSRTQLGRMFQILDCVRSVILFHWMQFSTFSFHMKLFQLWSKPGSICPGLNATSKWEAKTCIYAFANPDTNMIYVGQTRCSIHVRMAQHVAQWHRSGPKTACELPAYKLVRSGGSHTFCGFPLVWLAVPVTQHHCLFVERCYQNYVRPKLNMP